MSAAPLDHPLAVDAQKCLDLLIVLFDPVEISPGDFNRLDLAGFEPAEQFQGR